jgi:hypothetical protein
MKRKKRRSPNLKPYQWSTWFAWHPISIAEITKRKKNKIYKTKRWYWLKYILRKRTGSGSAWAWEYKWAWEYERIGRKITVIYYD